MFRILIALSLLAIATSSCDNSCSGHGVCLDNAVCQCYEGWGMGLSYDSGDCSQRICPFEYAWVDTPDRIGDHHKYIECSAKGICNRDSGECECFPGYEGKACARTTCPNDCSGHGQCIYLDNEPFKTVIGDYNNHKYGVTYDEEKVIAATTGVFTASPLFVANLVVNSRVAVNGVIYWVRSIASSTTFTLSASAPSNGSPGALYTPENAITPTTATILAPQDKRSFQIVLGVSGTSFASLTPHGLSSGDYVYLTGAFPAADENVDNYVFFQVDAVSSPTIFTLKQASGGNVAEVEPTATVGDGTGGMRAAQTNVICNVIDIKDVPQGQFDVVDPYTATSFIDKKYWDAKKTRGCVCDPQYGDVDCSARMCQYGTDVMDRQKDQTRAAQNHIQMVSMKAPTDYVTGFIDGNSNARSFALTFKSKLNETFTTIPIKMPILLAATTLADGLLAIRNFELDVEWALKNLPTSVVDGVKVRVTKPIDTTAEVPSGGTYANALLSATGANPSGAGSIGGTTSGHNVFEFSVEFSGNNVQGTQHYLTVEAAKCAKGCTPQIDGLLIDSAIQGNTYITVVTKPTFSTGMDNDMESDYNSYECGRRGKCDYKTGLCTCFSGYTGLSCNVITALV